MSHVKLKKSSRLFLTIFSESSIIDFIILSIGDILLYKVFFLSLAPFSQLSISDLSINFLVGGVNSKDRILAGVGYLF